MKKIAIYPGSFDPVTNGHLDIVKRGLSLFDTIIVTIMHNPSKKYLFSLEERKEMLVDSLGGCAGIEIACYDGLLVDYAIKREVNAILRGMRAVSDFEYEFQMALMNRKLNRKIQTVFLMTGLRWIFTSSSIIKEVARFNGDIDDMVPPFVNQKLVEKYQMLADGK